MRKIILLLFTICVSCSKYSSEVSEALKLAGENGKELEKVFKHYEKTEDSLKLKSAYFLVENMTHHYYYEVNPIEEWKKVLKYSDKLKKDSVFIKNKWKYANKVKDAYKNKMKYANYAPRFDIQEMKSSEMIENIELAFKVWPKPWNDFLDFEGFCNYILPYRISHEPYDVNFRKEYFNRKDSLVNEKFKNSSNIIEFERKFDVFENGWLYYGLINKDIRVADTKKLKLADCVGHSILQGSERLAVGIPSVFDYTYWPNGNGAHYWTAVMFHKDSSIVQSDFFKGKPGRYSITGRPSNIFRQMFAKQKKSLAMVEKDVSKIPAFFKNPYVKDVTNEYLPTQKVTIKLKPQNDEILKYAFLCIRNDRKWKPVEWRATKGNSTVNFDLVPENIYVVLYYENGKWLGASDPIIYNKNKEQIILKPSESEFESYKIARKSRMRDDLRGYAERLIGSKIELANNAKFKNAKVIYEIKKEDCYLPEIKVIKIENKYRYARLKSTKDGMCDIGELAWWSGETKLEGTVIGTEEKQERYKKEKAFDNDFLSFYAPKIIKGGYSWVGLDFGQKEKITQLKFGARSDVNYIKPGDWYELFYWNDEWVSLGQQRAISYSIVYESIPKNALLWIRNLSEGKEEKLFMIKDGKRVWL